MCASVSLAHTCLPLCNNRELASQRRYFTIDTTTLMNGVHTIAWVVRDSLGRTQGIGSRYFAVANP